MDGEGYGQGHARTCELTWGPNISDGIFELEIFNVKNPASRSTLSARRDWELWWGRVCLLCGFGGGAAQAGCGGYKVSLAKLLWLWFFSGRSRKQKGQSLAAILVRLWWNRTDPSESGEKCFFHFVISLLWALGLVSWSGGSSCLEICIIPPTECWPPSLGRFQLRLECPPIAPFEFWPKLGGWRWTWPYHAFCPFQVQAEMLFSFGA